MPKRLSLDEVRERLLNISYLLLEDDYYGVPKEHKVRHLICGTEYKAILQRIFKDNNCCPECNARIKYTKEDIRTKFVEAGFEFLDEIYTDLHSSYICKHLKCGTVDRRVATSVLYRKSCSYCAGNKKITYFDILSNLDPEKFELVSGEDEINENIVKYICKGCKNEYIREREQVTDGLKCFKCSAATRCISLRHEFSSVVGKFKEKGLIFLDTEYKGCKFKHNVQCDNCNYIYTATADGVFSGRGCPRCARRLIHSIEYIKEQYLISDLEFISETYENMRSYYETKCKSCLFEFKTLPTNVIFQRTGCPKCSVRKNEKLLHRYLSQLLTGTNVCTKTIKTPDLRCRDSIRVDAAFIYNKNEYIIEYNGHQHYAPVDFGQGFDKSLLDFEDQKLRDAWLRKYCSKSNIILIEIDGRIIRNEGIKFKLINELKANGVKCSGV